MKVYFSISVLALAIVGIISFSLVQARWEGELNPDELFKWSLTFEPEYYSLGNGLVMRAVVRNPDPRAEIKRVTTLTRSLVYLFGTKEMVSMEIKVYLLNYSYIKNGKIHSFRLNKQGKFVRYQISNKKEIDKIWKEHKAPASILLKGQKIV